MDDRQWLERAMALAREAKAAGDEPYGAVLVDGDGTFLAEARNTQHSTKDVTAHAETNLVRALGDRYDRDRLAGSTLYASGEPCPMCAAAIHAAGIGRIVFGVAGERLRAEKRQRGIGDVGVALASREVLARGSRPVEVVGPIDDEAGIALVFEN